MAERSRCRWVCLLGCAWALGLGVAQGQLRVTVERDGEELPVVAMDGEYPLVEVLGGRSRVSEGEVTLSGGGFLTDGGIRVLRKDAAIGQDYSSLNASYYFRFDAWVVADRDFEDCFILFAIMPNHGDESYVMREIGSLNGGVEDRIQILVPVNPSLGGGSFRYFIFSQGGQVPLDDPDEKAATVSEEAGRSGAQDDAALARSYRGAVAPGASRSPVKVVKSRLPDFPEALRGVVVGGVAEILYTVGEDGRVVEVLDVRADHPEFLPEMLESVLGSGYRPSVRDGRPVASTVQQVFSFNAFATFPEAIVEIAYPRMSDRDPLLAYAPVEQLEGGRKGDVKLEATITRLGRPERIEVLESLDDELATRAIEAARNWIFLPAVEGGVTSPRRISFTVRL